MTADDYLNEYIGIEGGRKVRRRDRMSISRINFLKEMWPSIQQFILNNQ